MSAIAKVIRDGDSQLVLLPKEFWFDDDEVRIKQIGPAIVIFPKDAAWDLRVSAVGKADDDFMRNRDQPAEPDKREEL
jgi:antitoxin VapB